jgi:Lecithin retinol acyltransferase
MTDAHLVAHHMGLEQEPPLGAHLATSRRGYHHHGVYVGRGRVVHYSGLSGVWQCGPVEEVSLSRFANGHPVRVVNHLESHYSPEEIVRCLSGVSRSAQVEGRLQLPLRILGALFHA